MKTKIYLHLRPEFYGSTVRGFNVAKMAKSVDASVMPGDYIVKLNLELPADFFETAMPSARVVLDSGQVVPFVIEQDEDAS